MIGAGCPALAYAGRAPEIDDELRRRLALAFGVAWLHLTSRLPSSNMIPAFLDGGRVLRAIVWVTGDANRSTRIAARVGQFVAFGISSFGAFSVFSAAQASVGCG